MTRMTMSAAHTHRHGSSTCYVHCRCRCTECVTGNSARERTRARQKAYGRYDNGLTDSAPVIAHIATLRSAGMGYKTIAARAGIGPTAVRVLIYGREEYLPGGGTGPRHGEMPKRITRDKATKILAVHPTLDMLPPTALVPARATMRRLQALQALGWSQTRLATQLGRAGGNLSTAMKKYERARNINKASNITVKASTALAVTAVYDRISNTLPPHTTHHDLIAYNRARRFAAARNWPLPMDWAAVDDDFDRHSAVRRSAS